MKPHERWWEDNPQAHETFAGWLDGSDVTSRELVGAIVDGIVREADAAVSVLEVGPGTYRDWQTLWRVRPHVVYHGVDVTPRIVAAGQAHGLTVTEGSIEAIPLPDRAVTVAYCRHVLEHLPRYEAALLELCRVASRAAVAVLWRLDVLAGEDVIYYDTVAEVPRTYHNMYSQSAISAFLSGEGIAHRWQKTAQDWVLIMDAGRD